MGKLIQLLLLLRQQWIQKILKQVRKLLQHLMGFLKFILLH